MSFIEMTGATLERIVAEDELHHGDLAAAGVNGTTIVRVNRQGDIEVRRPAGWDVIGMTAILWLTVILIPLVFLFWCFLGLVAVVLPIVGALKANSGEYFRYPVVGATP